MLTAARTMRRSAIAAARASTAHAASAAATASTRPAASACALSRAPLLPSRQFRAVAPRAVRAKQTAATPASSDGKAQSDSDKPDSKEENTPDDDEKVTGNEWRDLVLMSPGDQAELINSLPMFRHTCEGVTRFTWATSSDTCEGVLEPSEGGSWWGNISQRVKSITVEAKIMMELSNYVAVADRPFDTWKGVQQAHDIMFALFNTFHLAQSRAQLRTLCTKQVYEAVEASWKALDKYGLRLIYRSQVHNIQMLDLHIHDTDDWEPMGGGGGGGGGVKVPATGPLGVHPAGVPGQQATSAPPSSSSTQRMSSVPPKKEQIRVESSNTRTPVRYADLDVQVDVAETFELWSTRPDQKLEEEEPTADSTAAAAGNRAAAVPPASASDNKIVEDFEARLNTLEQQAMDASAGAHLNRVLSAINDTNTFGSPDATVAAAGTPTPGAPATPAVPAAPVAAATAADATPTTAPATPVTSASTATSSSSSSSTPPPPSTPVTPATPATGPDADWLPPLVCLSTISGHGERGMRFWTPLPPRNTDDRGKFIVPSVVSSVIFEGNSSSSVQMMERWLKEQLAIAKHPDASKAPKPSWIIKDILD